MINRGPILAGRLIIPVEGGVYTAQVYAGTPEHDALVAWLRAHDIDPNIVPAGTDVTFDRTAGTITTTQLVHDDKGRPKITKGTGQRMTKRITTTPRGLASLPPVLTVGLP